MPVFTEERVLDSVEILPRVNAIQVRWSDLVLRDGVVIAETYFRKSYVGGQRTDFETDVPSAVACADMIDWTPLPVDPLASPPAEPEVV